MLVDSHCHLNFPQFEEDFAEVLARCKEQGVGLLQTICTFMEEFEEVRGIAEAHEFIYCSVGVHPNNVTEYRKTTKEELVELTQHPKVIGIGETGLDYYRDDSPKTAQQESFRIHIQAAQKVQLPIIVHTRDAEEDTVAILKEMKQDKDFPALIHCFSASHWLAEQCLEMGIYLSIPGIVTFKNATALQDNVKKLPLEWMLVETDAPYLAPAPNRGKRNEPSFVRHTAEKVAELKGISIDEVEQMTTENFFRLFNKTPRLN